MDDRRWTMDDGAGSHRPPVTQHPALSTQHSLEARQATYDLLTRLYLAEPDAELARHLRGLPGFAELLPGDVELEEWLEDEAAEYQWLFGMNVYPYESIFVDRELMLNTEAADRVATLYRECGFEIQNPKSKIQNPGAPDHLGLELGLMGDLLASERRAHASGDDASARRARVWQARCLHEHLARWAPLFALTVQRVARRPLHRLLADLTVEMVLEEVGAVPLEGEGVATSPDVSEAPLRQPALGEEEPGINGIVRQLITPAEVGVFISRADINQLAASLELPVPVGDRFQMLRGLFAAAGQFETLMPLLDGLGSLFSRSEDALTQLVANYPAWATYGLPWQGRVSSGLRLVNELRVQASEQPDE